ncbi:hypothetical protein KIPB_012366, partial [Kipferlia bialata]
TANVLELAGRAKGIYAPLIPIAARRTGRRWREVRRERCAE